MYVAEQIKLMKSWCVNESMLILNTFGSHGFCETQEKYRHYSKSLSYQKNKINLYPCDFSPKLKKEEKKNWCEDTGDIKINMTVQPDTISKKKFKQTNGKLARIQQ